MQQDDLGSILRVTFLYEIVVDRRERTSESAFNAREIRASYPKCAKVFVQIELSRNEAVAN